jgi:hypothetical protein
MTTKQALIDLLLKQQETINLLRFYDREMRRINEDVDKLSREERDYWKKRAYKAENELIDIKLFGKTQPQPK